MECEYDFFPSTFAIIHMQIGKYIARKRETLVLSSSCLFAGAILRWLGLRWASVVKLGWERMDCVFYGDSSHAGSMKTTKNGQLVVVEYARACRTDFGRFSCSKSGTARHEHVHQ